MGQGRASRLRMVTTVIPGVGTQEQNKPVLSSESPFAVSGKELIQTGEGRYHVVDGTLTSCRLPTPDWQLVAKNFFLENGVARGESSWVELGGVPWVSRV